MTPFLADVDLAFLTMGTNATIVFFVFQKKKLVFFLLATHTLSFGKHHGMAGHDGPGRIGCPSHVFPAIRD